MTNSKLIIYLKTLSNTEMKDFGLFISISKGAKDAFLLFQYLKKYHPNYSAKAIEKEKVACKLFSKDRNNAKKLVNAIQRCSRLLDEFLIQEELKTQAENKEILFLQALKKRHLDTYFFRKAEKLEKEWMENPPPGLLTLHYLFRLKEMVFVHPKSTIVNKNPEGLKTLIKQIDQYYFAIKLYWYLVFLIQLNSTQAAIDTKSIMLIDEIKAICSLSNFEKNIEIRFFLRLLNVIAEKKFKYFNDIKGQFFKFLDKFSSEEKSEIANILVYASYQEYIHGKQNALQHVFQLNHNLTQNNLILENGCIQVDRFWFIVNVGLANKKIEWTENFVIKYTSYLPEIEKIDVEIISSALLDFHKSKYKEALQKLTTVKFHNVMYTLQARLTQLKCYFELGVAYEESFIDFCKSFSMFLFRNKNISKVEEKKKLSDFIHISKKIYKLKMNPNEVELNDIKKYVDSNHIASKAWLNEKISDLKLELEVRN